jgi:glycosyltransferase involved in cell wall biosynthesis
MSGYVDSEKLAALYAHSLCFVLPSSMEGLSIALLEAMGHGCPVIVSDIPENTEVTGDTGFTFPVGDWKRLRDHLAELIRDPVRAALAGEACRRRALATYNWDRAVDQLEDLYLDLAGPRRSTSSAARVA